MFRYSSIIIIHEYDQTLKFFTSTLLFCIYSDIWSTDDDDDDDDDDIDDYDDDDDNDDSKDDIDDDDDDDSEDDDVDRLMFYK